MSCLALALRPFPSCVIFGVLLVTFGGLWPTSAVGQGTRDDYRRAEALEELTRGKVIRAEVEPHWLPASSRFWYAADLAEGNSELVLVDPKQATRVVAFDRQRLKAALEAHGSDQSELELDALAVVDFDDGSVTFDERDKRWRFEIASGELTAVETPEHDDDAAEDDKSEQGERDRPWRQRRGSPRSHDERWTASIVEHNLRVCDRETGEEFSLSSDGTAEDGFEERFYWSPDSRRLVAIRTARPPTRQVHLIESSPDDQLQPKLHSFDYAKPGDPIPVSKPRLFDMPARREIPIDDELFPTPWDISRIRWCTDSQRFTFLYNERGHQTLRVLAVDAECGEVQSLIEERSPTFIDYAHKTFLHFCEEPQEIVWMSERDGWNHLYLIDARSGELKNQITAGPWVVREVDRVDEERRQIWFQAGGIDPAQDPYYVHLCRVNFDGTGLVDLTPADGTHRVRFSPDREYYIDSYSRVDLPPVHELRRSCDGALVMELERGDWSRLCSTGWRAPARFSAKGRDGQTDIYGVIYRPSNFDAKAKYPVIEQVYAGPQGAFVPKRFSAFHRPQALAELGFIVVQVDGMGTSHRSKAFHDVCCKNLADAGFPDRIRWLTAAAEQYPEMDLSRVGIYGGSAGGQSAVRALLAHHDFYHVAVADCGCHDNRMDKIWWNELWMGWPIGPHYEEQSNVTCAHRLQGKLLLIVGELDRNVDPASTMQVVNSLVKADKDFELLVMPGVGHGAAGHPYAQRRQRDFFVRHLLGVEPRRN